MDNRYFDNVIGEMKTFLDENGFEALDNGAYANKAKQIAVNYDEPRQMYTLAVADIAENGEIGDSREINAWLFDDSQNAKDATSVGIDFVNSLRKELGIKATRSISTDNVKLPTASKNGTVNVSGFAKKMLDVFPSLKESYKEHIAIYGNFLYINFFGEYLIPCLKTLLTEGNKKQIKKLYDIFDDAYVKGDKETVNIVVAVLCAAAYNDKAIYDKICEMLKENKHFTDSFVNFAPAFAKNKKLLAALVK